MFPDLLFRNLMTGSAAAKASATAADQYFPNRESCGVAIGLVSEYRLWAISSLVLS